MRNNILKKNRRQQRVDRGSGATKWKVLSSFKAGRHRCYVLVCCVREYAIYCEIII